MSVDSLNVALQSAIQKSNVNVERRHHGMHSIRHTFGSLQVDAGTSIYVVQKMLAHKNEATTQIYADMADRSKRESVNRITLRPHTQPHATPNAEKASEPISEDNPLVIGE